MMERARQTMLGVIGVAILAVGPVLPSFHLATSPHRYCVVHHAFEGIPQSPVESGQRRPRRGPGDSEGEHKTCLLATLMLQLVKHEPCLVDCSPPTVQRVSRAIPLKTSWPSGPIALVFLAPKTSPPEGDRPSHCLEQDCS